MPVQDAQSGARLHDATLSELGLTEQPFLEDKKRQPITDTTQQKTRAALEQHVRFGDSLHLLIGEDGAGKTILLQQLLKHCKNSVKPFVVKGSEDFQADAFLYAVLSDLKQEEQTEEPVEQYIDSLAPIFEQITTDQLSPVLIIDDAHLAPIEEIAVLVDTIQNFENEGGQTARLLLTGTNALKQSINRFEQQYEDLDLSYSTTLMQPLDETRTQQYLSARLHQAGFADTFPFTDKAISKIQRDADGLPGGINQAASHYLNGVYRGNAANDTKAGWLSSLEWPVLAIGAAALAAIGLGLSLFFGNEPETDVIPVAASDITIQTEQPVVEPSSISESTTLNASQDTLVLPETDSFADATPAVTTSESIEQVQSLPEEIITEEIITEEIIEETSLALPSATVEEEVGQATTNTAVEIADNTSSVNITVPVPSNNQDNAAAKSVGSINTATAESAGQIADNELLQTTDPAQLAAAINSTSDNSNVNETIVEPVSDLLGGDTDAAAPAPADNFSEPAEETIVRSDRAIENERWVLFQSPLKFTVQLATSRERSYIIELARTMNVQDPVAIYPFLTTNSSNPVFGLLSGLYDTRSDAIAAVENMSEEVKKFGVWIRPVSDLQADIKRRQ